MLQQRRDGFFQRADCGRRPFVAPHALAGLLDRGEIAQQRRDLPIDVHSCARAPHRLLLCLVPEPPLRPAATVVLLRDGPAGPEVFMVRRQEGTAFMAGAHVFPGGRVESADGEAVDSTWCDGVEAAAEQLDDLSQADATAFRVAAMRELFEESGVLLARNVPRPAARDAFISLAGAEAQARFEKYRVDVHNGMTPLRDIFVREGLRLALDALVAFAHWVTPPNDVRRFDTRFFLARTPPEQVPVHDDAEATHSAWLRPVEAMALANRDEIILPPPTWTTLRELAPFGGVDEAVAWARRRRIVRREPLLVERGGEHQLVLPGDPLHPERAERPPFETRFIYRAGIWRPHRGDA